MSDLMQAVRLPDSAAAAIIAHARAGKPEEICGVIRGRGLTAGAVVRGRNVAPERIENYELDPETLLLQFRFEEEGDEMMGIYHSHPVSVAYPSATDAWNAHYPECIYFICSLEHDDAPVIRAFRLTPHWVDVDAERLRQELAFYETRPGLFAYYQAAGTPAPAPLAEIAAVATPPFYVDFMVDDQGAIVDSRVVSVQEHPITSV